MKLVRADQLRRELRWLLDDLSHDSDPVAILRYQTPIGVLVSADWFKRACDALGEPVPDFVPVPDKTGEKK